jgi:hypothetical protein
MHARALVGLHGGKQKDGRQAEREAFLFIPITRLDAALGASSLHASVHSPLRLGTALHSATQPQA